MRNLKQKRTAFFLCLIGTVVICLAFLLKTAKSLNTQISISKETDFILHPDPNKGYNHDPNKVYNHIMVKIRPYKTFRLSLKLAMDDDTELWIHYSSTSAEPFQKYDGGPIHIGLDTALIDEKWHLIDLDISLDLENFVVSELRSIKEIEILGNRFDIFYIIAYRELSDGSQSNIIIDDFSLPGQDLDDRGWESTTMDQFSIAFDSDMQGYLKAKYTPETTAEDPNDTSNQPQLIYPYYGYYGYPYGSSYYGSSAYGGYYGGGYYGSSYYGGGYYGGGYYGGGYYGSGYYGGGYYGGGLYGGLGLGLYGGLMGLRNYYGGPIGLLGGLTFGGLPGLFV